MKAFFLSIPHSGEKVSDECYWLHGLEETHLMRDVDRYVDLLYSPAIESLHLEAIKTDWHRYMVDLNRLPTDIDASSVVGAEGDLGRFKKKGLHWEVTTLGEELLNAPISRKLHEELVRKYYQPWYDLVEAQHIEVHKKFANSYQLDCHSMPSVATASHGDAGSLRPQIVVSDFLGKSCSQEYLQIVLKAFNAQFDEVAYNDPYIGGRITETFGQTSKGRNCIQIEIRRNLYMDEQTKKKLPTEFTNLQSKLLVVVSEIESALASSL